jgi:sRNA-binding protein
MAPTASAPRGRAVPQEVFDFYLHLQERWPDVFSLQRPKPLVIGIDRAVQAQVSASPDTLKRFFRWYTGRRPYHEAMLQATHRYGLSGQPQDKVTDKARQRAQLCLSGKPAQQAAAAAPAAKAKAPPAKPAKE